MSVFENCGLSNIKHRQPEKTVSFRDVLVSETFVVNGTHVDSLVTISISEKDDNSGASPDNFQSSRAERTLQKFPDPAGGDCKALLNRRWYSGSVMVA